MGNHTKKSWGAINGESDPPDLEHKLVFAAVSLDRSKDYRIYEILKGTLNWSLVLQIATQNGVFPLVYQRLLALAEKQIPMEEISRWKALFQVNTQNNLRLTWKLVECVKLLLSGGITCVVLKGPIYALQAYGNIALRNFSDLDILIHPIDFSNANDILEKSGYVPTIELDPRQKKYLFRTNNNCSYTLQGDIVELHWDIAPPGSILLFTPDQLWTNIISINILDQDINTLSLEDTILYICLHGAKHGWNQLKWIVDLANVSRSISEDAWYPLLDHAKQKGLFRQVCLGLLLAIDLVNADVPSEIRDQLNSNLVAQALVAQVKENLFKLSNARSPVDNYNFYMRSLERLQDRLYYLLGLIFKPEEADWLIISLPEKMYFGYYFFRPLRLLYKYGKAAFSTIS
jgi:hypothetical protein